MNPLNGISIRWRNTGYPPGEIVITRFSGMLIQYLSETELMTAGQKFVI